MPRSKKVSPRMFPDAPMCGGKRVYRTEAEAEQIKDLNESMKPGLELNIYKCNQGCRGWHLTRSRDTSGN